MEKGVLTGTRCYLVGSMEYCNDGRQWRDFIKEEFQGSGITFFDPYHKPFKNSKSEDEESRRRLKIWLKQGKYKKVAEHMWPVRGDDLRQCDISDFIIAHIDHNVATIGTIEEITTSVRAKKPIFLISAGGKRMCPLWFFGMIPHKYIYGSLDQAVKMLKNIHKGARKIDNHRWKVLKDEYLTQEVKNDTKSLTSQKVLL